MRYQKNEIISMAIVYEGHLPQGYTVDVHTLASEIMDNAHWEVCLCFWLRAHPGHRAGFARRSNRRPPRSFTQLRTVLPGMEASL